MNVKGDGGITAVIVAGGEGLRLGQDQPKPLISLGSRPLVTYSLETFAKFPAVSRIILVCGKGWFNEAQKLGERWAQGKLATVVPGGKERSDSVRAGITCLPKNCSKVAIHDAARPFVTADLIEKVLKGLRHCHGAVPGLPLADTLRRHGGGISTGTPDRSQYVLSQTPQCFHRQPLEEAFRRAELDGFSGTDDAAYMERLPGARIAIVEGDPINFKITTPDDLHRARAMMEGWDNDFRVGEGFDAHRFTAGRKLILGGVEIPFELGLHGHSDADVLCHAVGDALLGAVSLGDLGQHFPDSDPAYEGISSLKLLERICDMVAERGYAIHSVDSTLVLQLPKIAPHRDLIRTSLAKALKIDVDQISVKATTTEGMGPEGRGEGITCRAVVLVRKK